MNSPSQIANNTADLAALADGIIPPDDLDAGAAEVQCGARLAAKLGPGAQSTLYAGGLESARALSLQLFQAPVNRLAADQIHTLLERLRDSNPGFFKQLRMDVSALYLSDPAVWSRIGFPGPSIEAGGYPDFDQPQIS